MKIRHIKKYEDSINYFDLTTPKNHNYVLENGVVVHNCGVGYSVERQEIQKLPVIPDELYPTDTTIIVRDSKLGWVQGLNELISLLYSGRIPKWDLSLVRPAGARLKTFGGRASGKDPINQLFTQVIATFKKAVGRRLNSLECHTIATDISAAVLCGGVRRCCFSDSTIELEDRSWKRFGDVEVGDKLYYFGDDCEVLEVEHSEQETLEIVLEDGTSQICTKEHRWPVYNHLTNQIELVFTEDLANGEYSLLEME
jgi:ribonucleoside-diphosphate reductase alpha chain